MQARSGITERASPAPGQAGLLQRRCACGGIPGPSGECAGCRERRLQRRSTGRAEPSTVPPIVHDVLRSPGRPLDPATRASMEPRFGHDFGLVRVHADARAAESARAVDAVAYTVGRNVVFGEGRYAPGTSGGQRLIAHELTHVVQQRGRAVSSGGIYLARSDAPEEAEAERVADDAVLGRTVPAAPRLRAGVHVQRQQAEKPAEAEERAEEERRAGEERRKLIKITATVLAESSESQINDVRHVYINAYTTGGEEKACRISSACRLEQAWFKIWTTILDPPGSPYASQPMSSKDLKRLHKTEREALSKRSKSPTFGDYAEIKKGSDLPGRAEAALKAVREVFEKPDEAYRGWESQGNRDDLNRTEPMWRMARQYLCLYQQDVSRGKPTMREWVKVLGSPEDLDTVQVMFNLGEVEKYLKENGKAAKDVPEFPFEPGDSCGK